MEGELKAERTQREALELKLGRMNLSGGIILGGGIDTKALHDERKALGAYRQG